VSTRKAGCPLLCLSAFARAPSLRVLWASVIASKFLQTIVYQSLLDSGSMNPPHLMTLADLSVKQIQSILTHSLRLKNTSLRYLRPSEPRAVNERLLRQPPPQSLAHSSIALLFSKRSTRTRVSAETAAVLLGGRALFLGREDIQLGVNESARDTARVLGGMCQGIFARVGHHSEIEVSH
jgi:ornithine carbamoyltransferase